MSAVPVNTSEPDVSKVPGFPPAGPNNINVYDFINNIRASIFVLHYKGSYRPQTFNFVADGLEDAKKQAMNWCNASNVILISVHPFIGDITKPLFRREHGDT